MVRACVCVSVSFHVFMFAPISFSALLGVMGIRQTDGWTDALYRPTREGDEGEESGEKEKITRWAS